MKAIWVILPAALLLLLTPANAAPIGMEATASIVVVHSDGPMNGTLGVLLIEHGFSLTSATRDPGFVLTASAMRLETDESDPALFVPGAAEVHGVEDVTFRTTGEDLGPAILTETASRADFRINVFASNPGNPPRVQMVASCSSMTSSDAAQIVRAPRANTARPDSTVSTADHLRLEPCEEGTLSITGDFVISLWETDGTLQVGGETRLVETGRQRSASDTQGPGLNPVVSRYEEIYVTAHDGALFLPWNKTVRLYTTEAAVVGTASLEMTKASGRMEAALGPVALDGDDVYLQGGLNATFVGGGVDLPLHADISGDVSSARVGATQLVLDGAGARAHYGPLAALWAVPALVAVVVVAVVVRAQRNLHRAGMTLAPTLPRRQRNAVAFWHAAADCLDNERWRAALRFAKRARRADPDSVDARYAWAVAQHKLNRPAEALAMYREIHTQLAAGPARAENAVAIALALTQLGRADEALPWLRLSFSEDPAVAQAWGRDRAFDALADHAWLRALRNARWSADPAFG